MAFIKPYDVTIDIHKGIVEGEFKLRQASDGVRLFKAKLNDGDNKFDLRGYKLQVVFRKRDGNRVDDEISEFDLETSIVEVPVKESVLNVSGLVICEIVVLDMNDVKYITFPPFHFVAEPNEFLGDGVTSTNEFNVLVKALARVDAINEIAEERFAVLDQQVDAKLKEYDNRFLEIKGEKGDVGPQGPQGIQGPKGDKGEKGDTGQDGAKGEVGPQGIRGPEGARGPQGIQGPKGDQGPQGPKGAKGDKGDKGDTGPQGPQGTQGPQGIQGIKGDKGDKGDKGEKGDFGELTDNDRTDYMGITHKSLRDTNNSNVDYAVKTAIGEFNYLDYEGQHITANNSIEGHTKSAILKGNTLVNLVDNMIVGSTSFDVEMTYSSNEKSYFVIIESNIPIIEVGLLESHTSWNVRQSVSNLLQLKIKLTPDTTKDIFKLRCIFSNPDLTPINAKCMIIEYQDGMENWDIPYFTGMSSVKMPVLKTTGKNLFNCTNVEDINNSYTVVNMNNKNYITTDTLVEKGKQYTLSLHANISGATGNILSLGYMNYSNIVGGVEKASHNIVTIDSMVDKTTSITFTAQTTDYIKIYIATGKVGYNVVLSNVQIEEGSIATSYESFKSNILTVNEPVELRAIGKVKDELNLLTGELTQRIGEIVLDGSEDWSFNRSATNHNLWTTTIANPALNTTVRKNNMLCNKLIVEDFSGFDTKDYEFISINNGNSNWIYLKLDKTKGSTPTELKNYLQSNPLTVQYQLATESIKTVDLSDNVVYSYGSTTHYSCSSEERSLVPTLSVKVPTDVQATIAQQRNTIQALESENEALKDGLIEANQYREDGDMDLLSNQWDIDFRLFEIEMALDVPMAVAYKIAKENDSMSRYLQAKTLILGGRYERSKMEYQLKRYLEAGQLMQEEYDELISLMDARELVE